MIEVGLTDDLNMGLFVVKSNTEEMNFQTKLDVVDKSLKIVLFLCKTNTDREQLHNAGFAIAGSYLCWSYPAEALVHVLDMAPMNAL